MRKIIKFLTIIIFQPFITSATVACNNEIQYFDNRSAKQLFDDK